MPDSFEFMYSSYILYVLLFVVIERDKLMSTILKEDAPEQWWKWHPLVFFGVAVVMLG